MENYEKAEKDYLAGLKYIEIAEKYGVTINTVKSWKKRYNWSRERTQNDAHKRSECVHTKNAPENTIGDRVEDGTEKTIQNAELTIEQQLFCIYYSRTFNAAQSYQKAYGCSYESAMCSSSRLLRNVKVREEIERLKEIKRQQIVTDTEDVVELQMRIAFSDLSNYLTFGRENVQIMGPFGPIKDSETGEYLTKRVNMVKLSSSENVDMQIVQEVKQGKDGVSVKLADRQKAIDWLTKYFLMHPESKYKAEYEKKRAEKEGRQKEEFESDGFLEALQGDVATTFEEDDTVET